jgi:flagellar biosynthesis/type III secretory pathway chaperone
MVADALATSEKEKPFAMTEPLTTTTRLAALITAKQQVLEILVQLGHKQVALITSGDMTSLMKLLAGKQSVMSHLQMIEQAMAPFRDEDPEARVWESPTHRAACQVRADQCNGLLREAMQLEQTAEAEMVKRRDSTLASVTSLHAAADARAAYIPLGPAAAGLRFEG